MSKAPSGWQKVLNRIIEDKQTRKIGGWLCSGAIAFLLWLLNWKLFLATVAGISSMCGCYLWQNPYWQRYCKQWQKFLVGSNRQLMLAVGSGGTGAFFVYLAASIWADAGDRWLATGAILQGCTSLITLSVLLWSLGQRKSNNAEAKFDRLVDDLSHSNSLKRLVAIRKLTSLLRSNSLGSSQYAQSLEYFYLMLSEPQLPAVKNALLESINLLDTKQPTKSKRPQVRIPIQLQRSRKPIVNFSSENRI